MPDKYANTDEILRMPPARTLDENKALLAAVFRMPENNDVVIKTIEAPGFRVTISYIDGLVDSEKLMESVIRPLIMQEPDSRAMGDVGIRLFKIL